MRQSRFGFILLAFALLPYLGFAEGFQLKRERSRSKATKQSSAEKDTSVAVESRSRRRSGKTRNPDNYSTKVEASYPSEKNFAAKLNVILGSSSSNTLGPPSKPSISAGILADLGFFKYFGAEAEIYFMPSYSQQVPVEEGSAETVQQGESQNWSKGVLKVMLPIGSKPLRLIPKLGVGYAVYNYRLTEEGASEITLAARGPCALVGVDLEIQRVLSIFVDYSATLKPSASTVVGDAAPEALADANVNTVRFGLAYRLFSSIAIGAQYTMRSFSATYDSPMSFGHLQYSGFVQWEL